MADVAKTVEQLAQEAAAQVQAAAAQAQAEVERIKALALAEANRIKAEAEAAKALVEEKIRKAKEAAERLKALKEKLKNAKLKKPKFPAPPVFKPKELPTEEIAKFNQGDPPPPPPPPSKGDFIKEYTNKVGVKLDFYNDDIGFEKQIVIYNAGTNTLVWKMKPSLTATLDVLIEEAESAFEYYEGPGK
jgi:hypothetical protein